MNAGDRDCYLTVQVNTETIGDLNEVEHSWADEFNIWAKEHTPSAKEISKGMDVQLDQVTFTTIKCDVTHEKRLKSGTKIYQIQSVTEKGDDLIIKATLLQ